MSQSSSLVYLINIFFRTLDGLFAVAISIIYWILSLLMAMQVIEVEAVDAEWIAGGFLMPTLFAMVHIWHRTGIPDERWLHLPSIVSTSIFAIIIPAIRFGVI